MPTYKVKRGSHYRTSESGRITRIKSMTKGAFKPARSETKFREGSVSGTLEARQGGTGQVATPSIG
jgi:hypothetical protein